MIFEVKHLSKSFEYYTNFPPMFVLNKMPPIYLAWSGVLPIILLLAVRLLWEQGLKSYSSASS